MGTKPKPGTDINARMWRALTAYALIAFGVVAVVAFVAAVTAVFVGVLWWIWTQDATALKVAGTGVVVGAFVVFTAGRIGGQSEQNR